MGEPGRDTKHIRYMFISVYT